MTPIPVILLRPNSRSCSTSAPDPYAHLLSQPSSSSRSSPSYAPYFVPVLDTQFVDEEGLQRTIKEGAERWGGVVVTSQRAVEAWGRAGEVIEDETPDGAAGKGKGKGREVDTSTPHAVSSWTSIPFFSIGPSTTNALLSISSSIRPPPEDILSPTTAGNTPSLAELIASHFATSLSSSPPKPLLYLTGDKNSPVLSQLLLASSPPITLTPHQTYLTSPLPSFVKTFEPLLRSVLEDEASRPPREHNSLPWVVLFSPSAVELAMPILRRVDGDAFERLRFAVIGPTTGEALRKELGEVGTMEGKVVEAVRPGAGGLVEVLRRRDGLM